MQRGIHSLYVHVFLDNIHLNGCCVNDHELYKLCFLKFIHLFYRLQDNFDLTLYVDNCILL